MEGPPCGEGERRRRRFSIGDVLGNADPTDSTRISVRGVTQHGCDDSIIVAFSPSSRGGSMSTTGVAEEAGGVSRVFTAAFAATG